MSGAILSYRQIDPVKLRCEIDLKKLFPDKNERKIFEKKWEAFLESDSCNRDIFKREGDRLKYKSEQLIPAKVDNRPPLLLVLGNPASHSVKEGMFFSFEGDKKEHRFWKRILKPAGVLDLPFDSNQSVTKLNKQRREALFDLEYNSPFRIGLCVFITMPSAPGGKWGGIAGIQKLLGIRALRRLEQAETERVLDCANKFLTPNGIAVAFQKNAWNTLRSSKDPEYKLSLAKDGKLKGRLKEMTNVPLFGVPPTRLSGPCSKMLRQLLKVPEVSNIAWFRFYEELNDFLPADKRKIAFPYKFSGSPSVKDVIEAIGVPHTEVDLILINGNSVKFDHILSHGDHISVYPVFETLDISNVTRLRPKPLRKRLAQTE